MSVASSGSVVVVGAPQCTISSTFTITATAGSNGYFLVYSCAAASCSFRSQIFAPLSSSTNFATSCFGFSVSLTNSGQFLAVGAPAYDES